MGYLYLVQIEEQCGGAAAIGNIIQTFVQEQDHNASRTIYPSPIDRTESQTTPFL